MKKLKIVWKILPVLLLIMMARGAVAQRFHGGIVLGGNAAQLDGDRFAGYDKLGLNAGLKVNAMLTEKANIGLELLYSQRGSTSKRDRTGTYPRQVIRLNYLEVPVMYNYRDWLTDEGYYKVVFTGGLSYGYLMNASTTNNVYEFQIDNFEKHDFSFLVGASFFINRHFGFTARYTRSFGYAFDNKHQPGLISLRSYFLTFRMEYFF